MSDGEGTTENKKWAKGKWTAQGKVRATSFNKVTRDGFGNQMTLEQRDLRELKESAMWLPGDWGAAGASQA